MKAETTPSIWMSQNLEGALAKAKAEHKVVVVDIYAEWCAQCHELDEKTWPDPEIQKWIAQNAIPIRIDTDKSLYQPGQTVKHTVIRRHGKD